MSKTSDKIKAVVIGPGAGEYVYSLTPKPYVGGVSNIKETIDKLKIDYINLEKVSIVVGWFGDTLDANIIHIAPRVESRTGDNWKVSTYTRETAELVKSGHAWTIGTPNDADIIELVKYLNTKGLKVTINPMLFVDDQHASWRGFISAKNPDGIKHFFSEYNKFIEHYASMFADNIETFIIGSELETLTTFRDEHNNFNAVDELIGLSQSVRKLVGDNVKITYAANWSEYHHSSGGWYHLDKLWADININFVGIDAYFPVTDEPLHGPIDPMVIAAGWSKGKDFDYYVSGDLKIPMDPTWGCKNFVGWWNSNHYNPDGSKTGWQPKMKSIVFTEAGFTALDASTNEPYKYFPALPTYSDGHVDPMIQYNAIAGTILFHESLQQNPETQGVLEEIFWYNIFPSGCGVDYEHNHELKVAWIDNNNPNAFGIA